MIVIAKQTLRWRGRDCNLLTYSCGNKATLKRKYKSSLFPIPREFRKNQPLFLVYTIKGTSVLCVSSLGPRVCAGRWWVNQWVTGLKFLYIYIDWYKRNRNALSVKRQYWKWLKPLVDPEIIQTSRRCLMLIP